jgi:hypothetical protein
MADQSQEWYKTHYLQQLENGEITPESVADAIEDADEPKWADDALIQGAADAYNAFQNQ